MEKRISCLLIWLLGMAGFAHGAGYFPLWQKSPPNITDLMLIYQGGAQRPVWTPERYSPYVTYKNPLTGAEHWLFDGFLYIEFADGRRHSYEPLPKTAPARKSEWEVLMAKNFGADGIPLLDQVCGSAAARIGQPTRRRQIVLTVPVPIAGQTNWGEIDGRALDFHNQKDQLAACQWYMDECLARWRVLAPKELELAGFYWLWESAPPKTIFLNDLAGLVHARGKQFFWIPYWQPQRAAQVAAWRSYGFDETWQQPNYFFHPQVPLSRLKDACDFSLKNGLGLEMELDGRAISDPSVFAPRLEAYLNAFTSNGVKDSSSIAWYDGGGALAQLSVSRKPAVRQYYDQAARFVLHRQALADSAFKAAGTK